MRTVTDQLAHEIGDGLNPGDTRLLTAKELSERLAISEKTIYAYVSKGLIPFIKIQSNVRFRPQAIHEWLALKEYIPAELTRRSSHRRVS